MITVTGLRVAPVKGLATVARDQVQLDRDGVAEDRRLFLLRADGSVLTQRRAPGLTRVVPDLDLAAGTLDLTLPDGTLVGGPLDTTGKPVRARLFGRDRPGQVVPGPVAEALSDVVGEPVRLVLADRTGLGWDEGPVSLVGVASVRAVGTPEDGRGPEAARYRMLVEVHGAEPYEEDTWVGGQVGVGAALLRVTHPLERCAVIDVGPATGTKDWPGVQTLLEVRGRDRLTLGVIAEVLEPGAVRVGDVVQPLVGQVRPA